VEDVVVGCAPVHRAVRSSCFHKLCYSMMVNVFLFFSFSGDPSFYLDLYLSGCTLSFRFYLSLNVHKKEIKR
jgi:hypothetical protein